MSVEYLVYNEICTTQLILDKFISIAPDYTERLQSIWKEMGISASAQHHRVEAVINYIQELLSDMVTDEENLLKELRKNTEICQDELLKLSQILGLSYKPLNENLTLVEKEKDLRTKLEAWNLEKKEREETFEKLREKEFALCKRLALPPHDTSIREVPTAKQIKEVEANINYMENELSKAQSQFQHARQSILTLSEELEIDITKTKFSEIASEESEECFVLSKENLRQLKEYLNKLVKQHEETRQQSVELMKKLKSLWTKLEINEKEQSAFKENCVGFRPSAIQMLKDEVDKYEKMKLKYTEKFIIGLRKELKQLWDKCFFSEDRRSEFLPAFDDNYTEESLALHEHQVHVMQGFYEDNKEIYKLVEKRENLWKRLMEIEQKENDPARLFSNRGGALLKELKKKNAVEKGLPKVEKDLKRLIESWQKENEDIFFVDGKNYLALVEQQQENRKKAKDLVKLGKQKEKKEAIAKEMVYGSKPVTPAKRLNRGNSFKISVLGKRKRDDKASNLRKNKARPAWPQLLHDYLGHQGQYGTTSSMTTSSLISSHCNSSPTFSAAKNKKKARRISCKIKKHQIRPYKRNSIEDTVDTSKDDDEDCDDSVHSLCTYPDFTSHIRRGREKELSSTAATVDSFQTLSPTDESEL